MMSFPLQTLIWLSAESNLGEAESDCWRKLDWEGFCCRIHWPPTEPDDWQESDSEGEEVERKGAEVKRGMEGTDFRSL